MPAGAVGLRIVLVEAALSDGTPVHRLQVDVDAGFAQQLRGHKGHGVDQELVGRRHDDDRIALVSGLGEELLGLGDVLLADRIDADIGLAGRSADEGCEADLLILLVGPHHGGQVVGLLADQEQRLAGFRVVERRYQVVRPDRRLEADRVGRQQLDVRILRQRRDHVVADHLDHVDLAALERGDRGVGIGDIGPFDAVDPDDLAAGLAVGRIAPGHIVGVLGECDHGAGDPGLADELEGTGADALLHFREGVGRSVLLAHDEERVGGAAQRLEHHPVGLLELEDEGAIVRCLEGGGAGHQHLAVDGAVLPALERGDDVLRGHGRAVMELEARTQDEGPRQLVVAGLVGLDHLRLRHQLRVHCEQHVVDHARVVVGDCHRRIDGVENTKICLRHHFQHALGVSWCGGGECGESDDGGEARTHAISPVLVGFGASLAPPRALP